MLLKEISEGCHHALEAILKILILLYWCRHGYFFLTRNNVYFGKAALLTILMLDFSLLNFSPSSNNGFDYSK